MGELSFPFETAKAPPLEFSFEGSPIAPVSLPLPILLLPEEHRSPGWVPLQYRPEGGAAG
jgi:hypothetical protein